MRGNDLVHLMDERLRALHERGIRGLGHLPGDDFFRYPQTRPVVVGQPQRNLDMENLHELNEVIRPAGRDRARAHGIFQRQVPADDPGKEFAQGGIGIRVGATRQGNHGSELRIAKPGQGAPESREHK